MRRLHSFYKPAGAALSFLGMSPFILIFLLTQVYATLSLARFASFPNTGFTMEASRVIPACSRSF